MSDAETLPPKKNRHRLPTMVLNVTNILPPDIVFERVEVERSVFVKFSPAMWELMKARVESERAKKPEDEEITLRFDGLAKNI